ncbi:MAG: energy transducer TonB [Gammaproteobacteria bacterium]|nr:energy transducer TonB [Gammaproteobacteria bacterium]MDX5375707.1 energy transducer TonB [Gammaproteobacteria bacterium]
MTAFSLTPQLSSNDRFGISLFLAAIVHGLVILGIAFGVNLMPERYVPPSLDVTLVQTETHEAPDDAKFIAQANQQASGSTDEPNRPTSPVTSLDPRPHDGTAPMQIQAQSPVQPEEEQVQAMTTRRSDYQVPTEEQTRQEQPVPDRRGRELVDRSLEIARLAAEISEREQRYAERPRRHYLSFSSAKSVIEADYFRAFKEKVERIGNLNYPDEALRRKLEGELILHVTVNRDGQVLSIELGKSSGHQVLDDAAKRIVRLSEPFAPFDREMRKAYDELVITRTWRFEVGGLTTR